jgi:hypothetical protein
MVWMIAIHRRLPNRSRSARRYLQPQLACAFELAFWVHRRLSAGIQSHSAPVLATPSSRRRLTWELGGAAAASVGPGDEQGDEEGHQTDQDGADENDTEASGRRRRDDRVDHCRDET